MVAVAVVLAATGAEADAGALQQVFNDAGTVMGSAVIVEGQDTGYSSVRNKLQ